MSTLIDFVARAGNKLDRTLGHARNQAVHYTGNALDRTLGRARKKVVNYTNSGSLSNDVAKVRELANNPTVRGTVAAATVLGGTLGGFLGCVKLAQGICEKHGYNEDNQCEEGMPGYTQIASLVMGGSIAVTLLPITMSTAYAVVKHSANIN